MKELFLQDLAINLDEITELQDSSVFKMENFGLVPYEFLGDYVV